jgi:hypothetical protein
MTMKPRSLIISTAPRPMDSHTHSGGEQGHSSAQDDPRVRSLHPENPLSLIPHYGQTLMRPTRSLRVSVIHLTHTLLDSLWIATTHILMIRTQGTKAFQKTEVPRRSRRRCGIWETASGLTDAWVHEDYLTSFIQVSGSNRRSRFVLYFWPFCLSSSVFGLCLILRASRGFL